MKIATILSKGVSSIEHTRDAVEFQKFCKQSDNSCDLFALCERGGVSCNPAIALNCEQLDLEIDGDYKFALKRLSSYDFIVVYGIPSNIALRSQNYFIELLGELHKDHKIFLVQLEHSLHSANKHDKLFRLCSSIDAAFTHSLTDDFSSWISKEFDGKIKLYSHPPSYNLQGNRDRYWKPIESVDLKSIKFLGKLSGWKGPEYFIALLPNLIKAGFASSMEGIEMSVGALDLLLKNSNEITMEYYGKREIGIPTHGGKCIASSAYNYHNLLNRLSNVGFGVDLYHLPSRKYGRSTESNQCDIISVGCLPVFNKHYGDNVKFLQSNDVVGSFDSGIIWMDSENIEVTLHEIIRIANDPKLFNERRNSAFEFWKKHTDSTIIQQNLLSAMLKS